MPIVYQKLWYTREQICRERENLFVFGDNLARRGLGGQAKAARGEINAIGIATKRGPTMSPDEFFNDDDLEMLKVVWQQDFQPIVEGLYAGQTVIWPADGIGTGLSKMPEKAPICWKYLEDIRKVLEQIR